MPNPEEYRRTRRIVDLLLRVANAPRRWTRRDLADLYEVSEQQIDKDVSLIRNGLVMPLRHSAQGYYFDGPVALPTLSLSFPEALSLLLAARLAQQMPGISRADLAAAIARVESLMPARLASFVGKLDRSNGGEGDGQSMLLDLQLAVAEGARLKLLYHSASQGGAAAERLVDPYTLVAHQQSWYLVAYCHLRHEIRMFKVDRIEQHARTGESFSLPDDFDLADYLGQTFGLLLGEAGEPEEVVLEFVPEAAPWLRDQQIHPGQIVDRLPNGGIRLSFQAGVTAELRRWVLGFGRQARVVQPASLAAWVEEEVRGMWEGIQ